MGGPPDGKYRFQHTVPPKLLIGVDSDPAPAEPVITEGSDNVVSPLVFI